MEQVPFESVEFKNFDSKEITVIGHALAIIFTRRLILEERARLFSEFEKLHIKIQDGVPEIFSIPTPGISPNDWIPAAKYKIHTSVDVDRLKLEYNVSKIVWLEIRTDSNVEKSKKDTMNFVSQDPKNVVLTCFVSEDRKDSLLILKFYLMQRKGGWKKIKEYYYTSFKNPNSPVDYKNKNLEIVEFKDLSSREKGEIGEALATIFTKRLFLEEKSFLLPEYENECIRVEKGISAYFSNPPPIFSLNSNPIHFGGWNPDGVFQILTNEDPFDLILEINPKKIVYLEVKTMKNARFERTQISDMNELSKIPANIVLFCQVFPADKYSKLIFNFHIVRHDSDWEIIKQYYYSDFPPFEFINRSRKNH